MNQIKTESRRGGRTARKALRSAPLPDNAKPVRGGMLGGNYRPLKDTDISKIHNAALTILEEIGFASAIPSCIDYVTQKGGFMRGDRLCMPRALVEDTIRMTGRHFTLHARNPKHDMQASAKRVYFGTGGAAVHVVDYQGRHYRESTLQDLYDAARIADAMDNIHFFQRPVVARDMIEPLDLDVNTLYACLAGTSKHIGTGWVHADHFAKTLPLLHYLAGGEEQWRQRPFISQSNCFVVPPLKFAADACYCLESAVHAGMPVLLLAAGQAGATSPSALAGAVVQEVAEVLGGLVYINAIKAGATAIFAPWPFVSDLRTGAMSGGSGEQALLMAACAQMADYYDLCGGMAAGMADSKMPDVQAGYEKGINYALVGQSGVNLVYEAAGMHASLLGFSLESLVIDNDAIGNALRTVRGIDVNEESLSIDVIKQVCLEGPGHFLGSQQTLQLMQSEYFYPSIGDRSSPKEWAENEKPDVVMLAQAKVQEILKNHNPATLTRAQDNEIRRILDIKLPQQKVVLA